MKNNSTYRKSSKDECDVKITLVKICINLRDIVDISIIFKMEIHSEKSCTNKMHKLTTDEYRNHSKSTDTVLCESG